jgi:hypothetical protein
MPGRKELGKTEYYAALRNVSEEFEITPKILIHQNSPKILILALLRLRLEDRESRTAWAMQEDPVSNMYYLILIDRNVQRGIDSKDAMIAGYMPYLLISCFLGSGICSGFFHYTFLDFLSFL